MSLRELIQEIRGENMSVEFRLEMVDTKSIGVHGIYFIITKETKEEIFEMDFDDETLYPILASSMGWNGEPDDCYDAACFLRDQCPSKLDFVGVNYFWQELGGDLIEEEQRLSDKEEHLCDDCGCPQQRGDKLRYYEDRDGNYMLCDNCFTERLECVYDDISDCIEPDNEE